MSRAESHPNEAVARLLRAWRGEVEAGAVYAILAERETDPRRAAIIRQMAEAEGRHRARIEARLRELGAPIPDPATVRLSAWEVAQARLAPVARVLAAREAAEDEEIEDRYLRPTGDAATDRLLSEIRADEARHAQTIGTLRRGAAPPPPPARSSAEVQQRLDQIRSRETWHRSGTGWISGAIYGANDGLAAVFGIVAGVSGATGGSHFVLTAGLAGALASALSMATGAFLAERSAAEVTAANLERERAEIEQHPDEEREELSLYYQLKGLSADEANDLATTLSRHPDAMLRLLAAEEFEGGGGGNPIEAALAAGLSTGLGAIIPVLPFFWLSGTTAVVAAAIVSLVAHFLVGAAKSLFTLRSWWSAGLEMTVAGVIVGVVTYVAGILFAIG
ncbi:MAG TPA: VIT1/CCC1 transporter family protein [Thermomicrobiales bacterium]|nr:VIT1/CCC1 transporter family protein [Thermomicrobiales bacterium]